MNFPELPGPRLSVEILQKPRISRPIPISDFGVPIFSVLGGNEVDMLGSAEVCCNLPKVFAVPRRSASISENVDCKKAENVKMLKKIYHRTMTICAGRLS